MTKDEFIEYCKYKGCKLTDDQFSGKEKIVNLLLVSLTEIPEGFNPVVGGSLNLSSLTSISKEFNPNVGGSLTLSSLTSIPKEFNPMVNGDLFLDGLKEIPENLNLSKVIWCVYIGAGSGDDDGNGKLFENIKPMLEFINFQI